MTKLRLLPTREFIAVEVIYTGDVDEEFDAQLRHLAGRKPDARASLRGVDRDQSWYFDIDDEKAAEKLAEAMTDWCRQPRWAGWAKSRERLRFYRGQSTVTMKVFGDQTQPIHADESTGCPG